MHTVRMATDSPIGTAIKRARERKRWTQRQLADALGVNIKSVDNWESGRTRPRNRTGAIEDVLGIDLTGENAAAQPEAELADLLPPLDDWEAAVLADDDLPARIKRRFILDSRQSRAAYDALRRSQGGGRATGQAS